MAIVSLRRPRAYVRRHRTSLASWTALAAVGGGLLVYAIGSEGQTVHRAELNDGGVWVTNQAEHAIGRQNMPVEQLDAYVDAGANALPDVLQDGAAVVSVDGSVLTPVNVTTGRAVPDGAVNAAGPASLAGGSLAAVDPEKGKVWAARVSAYSGVPSLSELDADADPRAEVGPDAKVVAARTGTVIAASGSTGKVVEIVPKGAGFATAAPVDVPKPKGGVVAVTAVGGTPVVLDGTGRLLLPGTGPVEIADAAGAQGGQVLLQQPGPDADEVAVATDQGLLAVGLDNGKVRRIDLGTGQPVAPVRMGPCVFGVWAQGTAGQAGVACDDADPVGPNSFELTPAAELVFRTNRNQLVLNDVRTGAVWSMNAAQPVQIADWQAIKPQTPEESQDDEKKTDSEKVRQAPEAKTDDLGARAGGTTVLHVLDNDLVSGGGVLTITKVTPPADKTVQVQASPDRQSLLLTVPPSGPGSLSFGYSISDGSGGKDSTADGIVNVDVKATSDPGAAAPTLRKDAVPPTYPMAARGHVEFSVLADWRDEEYGDPVSLDGFPDVPAGIQTSVTADGLIRVQGAGANGQVRLPYEVSTGGQQKAAGFVTLDILPKDSTKAVAPQALPDVVSGEAGGPITVLPLDNDIPGADPSDAQARLTLAGRVAPKQGLDVATDLQSGRVTVRASKPGTYQLDYAAGFGAASRTPGKITVVVDPASDKGDLPIAAPDNTTVHGAAPIVVDVLANDYDPKGRMLAVQQAKAVDPDSGLEVAVVDGRWLRISGPVGMPPGQRVEYTVSNGSGAARSSVAVTQKDPLPPAQNIPIPTDDDVVVREGDSAVVPVLDNDSTPGGDPVGLRTLASEGLPLGELPVDPPIGRAFVSGRNVRFVAPAAGEIDGPTDVVVQYVVQNEADPTIPTATGQLRVTINPEPTDETPNQAPTPRAIEGRVVQGDQVTLRPPLSGNDPDGDSITVVGIDRAPALGRLLSFGADSMVYQAFPGSQGTDEFTFRVQDRFGAVAVGSARVAVTPAGAPQAPVAVNDVVVAAPGRQLQIDVIANDLRAPGTGLELLPLEAAPDGVTIDEKSALVRATAPDNTRTALVVPYRVTTGFEESSAELSIRSEKGYNNPPVVEDAYARPEGDSTEVVVDVLASAYDIDGEGTPVQVESASGMTFARTGKVTVPVAAAPQVVPFTVVDGEGATATASIYVPALPKDTPYLKPGKTIQIEPGETKKVPVSDLVVDPEGDALHLTLADKIVGAPAGKLQASAPDSDQTLVVTAAEDAYGPGAVTFEVADGKDLATAHLATLSVPVTIGSGDPVLNCPQEPITVVQGGVSRAVDIATVCHVWAADPRDAEKVDYTADWADGQKPADVTVAADGGRVKLTAGVKAAQDATGVLEIGARGADIRDNAGRKPTLLVRVVRAGPPSLRPMTAEGEAGKTVTVDVASYAKSPFGSNARWALVGGVAKVGAPAGGSATTSVSGTKVSMTPSAFGVYTFRVTLADDGEAEGSTRPRATALITLSVVSEPGDITDLRTDGTTYSEQVKLLWTPPSANGGTINGYTVSYNGGTTSCPSNACTITGLGNGKDYTFSVVAHNQYGDSLPSNAVTAKPDRVPDAVTGLTVSKQHDGEVELSWSPPADLGYSPIKEYRITWPGAGEIKTVPAGARSYPARIGTNGENTTFEVWAYNEQGDGPKSSVTGMGAGKPEVPVLSAPQTSDTAGRSNKAVTVSWGAVGANGPDPVQYEVTRTAGGSSKVVCSWITATSCADTLGNDGTVYSYVVRARNAEATSGRGDAPDLHTSAASAAKTVEAAAVPETVTGMTVVATGVNGQAKATFDVHESHGKTNKIECDPGCGSLGATTVSTTGQSGVTFTVNAGSNGSNAVVRVRTCNGAADSALACSPWVSDGTTPYGPIPKPTISTSVSGTCINWAVSGSGNGKRVDVKVTSDGAVVFNQPFVNGFNPTGQQCLDYGESRTYVVAVTDTPNTAEQIGGGRGTESATSSASTPNRPPAPTIANFNAVDGGCLCGGPFLPIQVGISWDTTYATPISGAVCVFTMDGADLLPGADPGCPTSGHASHQFGVPAGYHTFCGYIRLPDGRESNHQCESGTWNGS